MKVQLDCLSKKKKIEDTYRTFEINLFEWADARYKALSFGWGHRVWALGLIALGLPRSVHLEYERLEWMMSTPPKEAMVVFMEDGHCLDFNFLKYSFFLE